MPAREADRRSNASLYYSELALIPDEWFDPGSSTRPSNRMNIAGRIEIALRSYVREGLVRNGHTDIALDRRLVVITARDLIVSTFRRARTEGSVMDRVAAAGQPHSVRALLDDDKNFTEKDRVIGTAHLVAAFYKDVYPTSGRTDVQSFLELPKTYKDEEPKPNARDAADHMRAGLISLARGVRRNLLSAQRLAGRP